MARQGKEPAADEQREAPRRRRSVWREYFEALLIAALFLRFANTFVVQTFYIPSGSMEETLLVGDHLFVNRFIYGEGASASAGERDSDDGTGVVGALLPHRDVRRGDIVVFRSPKEPTMDLVKRCIGLPGDIIEIEDKRLKVNGEPFPDQAYARNTDPRVIPNVLRMRQERVRDNFGPYEVPADHYFCLGDNRDFSYDSRFWGSVPRELVKGRAVMIYWSGGSPDPDERTVPRPHTGPAEPESRLWALLKFPVRTRWERTFRVIR